MTKRELEADAGEACELPIAAGGGGVPACRRRRARSGSATANRTLYDFFFIFLFFLSDLLFQLFFSLLSIVVSRHWAAPRATKGTPDAFV